MSKYSKIFFIVSLVAIVALAFGSGYYFSQNRAPVLQQGPAIFNEAWNYLSAYYVDPTKLNTENMTRAAIAGMISTLDDRYTTYLSNSDLAKFFNMLEGQYAGIGSVVSMQDGKIVIVHVYAGSPSEKAGLKRGDIVLAVNGESVAGLTLDMAVAKVRGTENTTVTLTILSENKTTPVDVVLTREIVEVPSVEMEMLGDIAHIGIYQFTDRTEDELVPILQQIKQDNAKGIVLDLRGNTGGWLESVIQVASNFIPEGIIVKVENKDGIVEIHEAIGGEETTDLPMVVLVDEYSASGSEVLTGALQDYKRAVVAGNTTYGKGSVTLPVQLSDGSGLYITISRWLTPNDRLIEGLGITPDFKLELTGEAELQWAIDYLLNNMIP